MLLYIELEEPNEVYIGQNSWYYWLSWGVRGWCFFFRREKGFVVVSLKGHELLASGSHTPFGCQYLLMINYTCMLSIKGESNIYIISVHECKTQLIEIYVLTRISHQVFVVFCVSPLESGIEL